MTTDVNNNGTATPNADSNNGGGNNQQPTTTPTQPNSPGQVHPTQINIDPAEFDRVKAELDQVRGVNETLAGQYRNLFIRMLPEDRRAAAQEIFNEVDKRNAQNNDEAALEVKARQIYAREQVIENKDIPGVTYDELVKLDSPAKMQVYIAEQKANYYKGIADGTIKPGTSGTNPGSVPSDKGGSASSGSPPPKVEGKGRDAVAQHLQELMLEHGNRR